MVPRVVSHAHGLTLKPPCRNVIFAGSLYRKPALSAPRGISVWMSAVTEGTLLAEGS